MKNAALQCRALISSSTVLFLQRQILLGRFYCGRHGAWFGRWHHNPIWCNLGAWPCEHRRL